jgi:hypothetical protein
MSQPEKHREFDAVLGGSNRLPEGAAGLGGIQGLLIHYQEDTNPNNRIVIIQKALNYGKKGTDFLLEVIKNDDFWEVKDVAYELLLSKDSELAESSGYIPQVFLKLNSLLQAQNFKEADLETRKIMLAVANREKEGYLRIEDAEKFPCKELRSIDKLWLEHSEGKFGISVQQQIYQSLGETKEYKRQKSIMKESMGKRVGWRNEIDGWLSYMDYNFSRTAPSGHLPCVLSVGRDWRRWQFFLRFSAGGIIVLEFALRVVFLCLLLYCTVRWGFVDWRVFWCSVLGWIDLEVGVIERILWGLRGVVCGLPSSCSKVAKTLLLRHAECNT